MFPLLQTWDYSTKLNRSRHLYEAATGSSHLIERLRLERKLEVHQGCVNTVCWNSTGTLLLSGADDHYLVISDPFKNKIKAKIQSGHNSNIFSAKFLPGSLDRELISCSGGGDIFYTFVNAPETYGLNRFDCHFGTVYEVEVVPNETKSFLSCGCDGTVRFFDLRTKTSCSKPKCDEDVLINLKLSVTALAVDPLIPYQLAVASLDGLTRIYDRRMLGLRENREICHGLVCYFVAPCVSEQRRYRITSLAYRPGSHDVLVNYCLDYIYLFNTYDTEQLTSDSNYDLKDKGSSSAPITHSDDIGGKTQPINPCSENVLDGNEEERRLKTIKRLRMRGDWSDTGPDSRPETEDNQEADTTPASHLLMQRVSNFLTEALNASRQNSLQTNEVERTIDEENPGVDELIAANDQQTQREDTQTNQRLSNSPVSEDKNNSVPKSNLSDSWLSREDSQLCTSNDDRKRWDKNKLTTTESDIVQSSFVTNQEGICELDLGKSTNQILENKNKSKAFNCTTSDSAETNTKSLNFTLSNDVDSKNRQSERVDNDSTKDCDTNGCTVKHVCSLDEKIKMLHIPTEVVKSDVPSPAVDACSEDNRSYYGRDGKSSSYSQNISPEIKTSNKISDTNTSLQEGSSKNILGKDGKLNFVVSKAAQKLVEISESNNSDEKMMCSNVSSCSIITPPFCTPNRKSVSKETGINSFATPIESYTEKGSPEVLNTTKSETNLADVLVREVTLENKGEKSLNVNDFFECEKVDEFSCKICGKVFAVSQNSFNPSRMSVCSNCVNDKPDVTSSITNMDDCVSPRGKRISFSLLEKSSEEDQESANKEQINYSGKGKLPLKGKGKIKGCSRNESSSIDSNVSVETKEIKTELKLKTVTGFEHDERKRTAAKKITNLCRKAVQSRKEKDRIKKAGKYPLCRLLAVYRGHRNCRTMIKEAGFYGEKFVMSGSDCGRIFIWERETGKLVSYLNADKHVVNCVQTNPHFPIIASSGIDYDIKLWMPSGEDSIFDETEAERIIERNRLMMQETKDTLTVPVSIMLRILASLTANRRRETTENSGNQDN